jgi:hypothetical protein
MTIFRESLPKGARGFIDWLLPRLPKRLGNLIN